MMKHYTRDEKFICKKCVPIEGNEGTTIPEETRNKHDAYIQLLAPSPMKQTIWTQHILFPTSVNIAISIHQKEEIAVHMDSMHFNPYHKWEEILVWG